MGNAKFAYKIQIELIKLLYQQVSIALWSESFAAMGLVMALWGVVNSQLLIGWLGFNLLICGLARHILVFSYKKSQFYAGLNANKASLWLYLFMLGAFFSGLSWGAAGSLLMVKHDIMRQTFTVLLLIGVTSAANSFYSPMRRVYAAFLFPAFVPFVFWLMLQGGIFIILGILALIYTLIMLATSFYAHKLIFTSLALRFENSDLVNNLSTAKTSLENRHEELEKSLGLVKATLESTTDGIVVVNSENIIEDFNRKFVFMWNINPVALKGRKILNVVELASDQLVDPLSFRNKIEELATNPQDESFDELLFKDGRVYERYSQPQCISDKCVGRVWSFRDVTGRKYLEAELFHQANFDSLTGLPNRALVLDRITQAISYAKRSRLNVAVLFLDLDRFKLINDTLGHVLGDKLLIAVAKRLKKCIRENDTVSREGGDEFIIILTSLQNESDTINIACKCLEALSEPFVIDKSKFSSTISIGVSVYPRDGTDAETLIRNADIAMYRAKELGRNNFQFFTDEMNKKVQTRLLIENQLHDALEHNQFSLVYQPIVSLQSKHVVAIEALLRWQHPSMGSISPIEFIPVAEESGMIIQIGQWVLRTACSQAKTWQQQGIAPVQMCVNVSARQFKQINFVDQISEILQETELDPRCLVLELTESIIMDEAEKNIKALSKLKKLGVMIVIDDFGVGFSSLNYLKRLPVDKLKIDRSFVQDIPTSAEDAAITSGIIALALKLNLKVVAEGVENKEQLNFLIKNHCDEFQGFYFSEPLEAEAFVKILIANKEINFPSPTFTPQ